MYGHEPPISFRDRSTDASALEEARIVSAAREKHDRMLNVRISAADQARLDRVARAQGLSYSATVRFLVKQAADRIVRKSRDRTA